MRKSVFAISLLLSLILVVSAQTSSVKNVKRQQQATQKEIKETSRKLQNNTAETRRSLNQLNLIEAEMSAQQANITNLSNELSQINSRMTLIADSIKSNEKKLQNLRANYAKAVRNMHAHSSSFDRLLFLFSSSSFHQAFRRMRYLQQFSRWRAHQSKEIAAMQEALTAQHNQVKSFYNQKNHNLSQQNSARLTLAQKKQEQSKMVASLQKEGGQLKTLLAEKRQKAQALDQQLDRLIAEEERRAAERARRQEEQRLANERAAQERKRVEEQKLLAEEKRKQEAEEALKKKSQAEKPKSQKKDTPTKAASSTKEKKETPVKRQSTPTTTAEKPSLASANTATSTDRYQMSSQERSLSGNFESNKGRLLFPVSGSYRIVKPFGRQRHPELKYVETDNGGIDIETPQGTVARAVFNGTVSAVFRQDGFNTVVMVRHGNYLTIYVNLADIYVNPGQSIKANQAIGKVFSDPEDNNRTILHFEVRRERTKLNPQEWVR